MAKIKFNTKKKRKKKVRTLVSFLLSLNERFPPGPKRWCNTHLVAQHCHGCATQDSWLHLERHRLHIIHNIYSDSAAQIYCKLLR